MQTLSAYLLEKRNQLSEAKAESVASVRASVDRWLIDKGVLDPGVRGGEFESQSPGGGGKYSRNMVSQADDFVEEVLLEERANENQTITTRIAFVSAASLFGVYGAVSTANIGSVISPMPASARCPAVIRDILRKAGDWRIGDAVVPSGRAMLLEGESGGAEACRLIASVHRKFPLVLVSEADGEQVWDAIDKKIAYDLVGIAEVISIDEDASWVLSEQMGRKYACYGGAIRLYWPSPTANGEIPNTVWTAERLLAVDIRLDPEERFRSLLRRKAMSVAALSITEPLEIAELRSAVGRKRLTELEGKVSEFDQIYELAQSYANDVDSLSGKLAKAQADLAAATTRAENAEAMYESIQANDAADVDSDEPELAVDAAEIQPGEIRFYKKRFSRSHYDVMVQIQDCGHNNWQSAPKAEKAKKGVAKHEGRDDWSTLHHCNTCQGGGVWRVRW